VLENLFVSLFSRNSLEVYVLLMLMHPAVTVFDKSVDMVGAIRRLSHFYK
jgi:hypothetical protein